MGVTLRLVAAAAISAMLGACSTMPTATPEPHATSIPTATPFVYPDLPGRMEDLIAKGDCDSLDLLARVLEGEDVDPVVRARGMEAIVHRSDELGC